QRDPADQNGEHDPAAEPGIRRPDQAQRLLDSQRRSAVEQGDLCGKSIAHVAMVSLPRLSMRLASVCPNVFAPVNCVKARKLEQAGEPGAGASTGRGSRATATDLRESTPRLRPSSAE